MTAINDMLQEPVSQAIGWALLQFVWQGALIGLLTAGLLAALRNSAADVRYVVATIGLSLMLTMPVVTAVQTLAPAGARVVQGTAAQTTVRQSQADPMTLAGSEPCVRRPSPASRRQIRRRGAAIRSRAGCLFS